MITNHPPAIVIKGSGMKYTLKFIVITVLFMLIFYRVDSTPAMAAEENTESFAGPQTSGASADLREEETEETGEPAVLPEEETEETGEPAALPEEETEETEEPAVLPEEETEETGEPAVLPEEETEETGEPAALPEEEAEGTGASADLLEAEPEDIQVAMIRKESEDTVSTGPELMEWLDSHKNTGGTVRLLDHIVLDQDYSFFPNGSNMPAVYVDTDRYTITVTAEVELSSDSQLTFSGEPEGKGIFCVAKKGMLSILGIAVESQQCALWQEEGGGLVVSSCHVSGDVHYADTPYVMYWKEDLCAVVEKGQTVNEVLPSQISCTVNCQGRLCYGEPIPVLWNLEGSEKQQEERLRFSVQGVFLNGVSLKQPSCTVAYNDYPLTFTEVEASSNGFSYTFQGGFTAPEEALPFTVMAEYSFDGEQWILYEEQRVTNADAGFRIDCKREQYGRMARSSIYIRLQWNDNGTRYYSNVLCYLSDNLEVVEDIGGRRGGGTSITNPPDEPQQSGDIPSDSADVRQEAVSDTYQTQDKESNSDQAGASKGISDAEPGAAEAGVVQPVTAEAGVVQPTVAEAGVVPITAEAGVVQPTAAEAGAVQPATAEADAEPPGAANADEGWENSVNADLGQAESSNKNEAQSLQAKADNMQNSSPSAVGIPQTGEIYPDTHRSRDIVLATGVVLLSVLAGTAAFCVHSRSGTNR